MTNEKITLTVRSGAKCAVCHNRLSIRFRKNRTSIAELFLECATCPASATIAGGEDAYISIETISYPDLEADIKDFPHVRPRNLGQPAFGMSVERIVESARYKSVASARRAVKSEIDTDYMRTYKYSDGEKEAASERLRLLAIDMQRAEKADIDNLALHIDSIREGVARGHAAPDEEAPDEQAADEEAGILFTPFTDALAEIDAADDADFGLLLIGVRDAARYELGRDDMSLLEAANIVGRRGYQVEVTDGGIGWVRKRDG